MVKEIFNVHVEVEFDADSPLPPDDVEHYRRAIEADLRAHYERGARIDHKYRWGFGEIHAATTERPKTPPVHFLVWRENEPGKDLVYCNRLVPSGASTKNKREITCKSCLRRIAAKGGSS